MSRRWACPGAGLIMTEAWLGHERRQPGLTKRWQVERRGKVLPWCRPGFIRRCCTISKPSALKPTPRQSGQPEGDADDDRLFGRHDPVPTAIRGEEAAESSIRDFLQDPRHDPAAEAFRPPRQLPPVQGAGCLCVASSPLRNKYRLPDLIRGLTGRSSTHEIRFEPLHQSCTRRILDAPLEAGHDNSEFGTRHEN
jgi:hypothetical protein